MYCEITNEQQVAILNHIIQQEKVKLSYLHL